MSITARHATTRSLTTVDFHGTQLQAVRGEAPETILIAMKPVVEGMGLDWSGQHAKIKAHPILGATMEEFSMVAEDGKQREMACLPLNRLNFWLATIQPNKVPKVIRPKVIEYQTECADVLFANFFAQAATQTAAQVQLNDPEFLRSALLGYTERVIALESENQTLTA